MHLTRKQILLLLSPILISIIVYLFSSEIVGYMQYIYPNYQEYNTKTLNKNVQLYNEFAAKKEMFNDLQKKIQLRKENAGWMSNYVLYQKEDSSQDKNTSNSMARKKIDISSWQLEATFPKRNVAIINGKIVKLGSTIKQVKVVSIKNDKVLLQYKKGFQWVYMFR